MREPDSESATALQVVLCATATQMTVAMSNIVLPTVAPKVAETLAVSPVLIGYQVSLTFGVAAIASVFGGTAVLRWGAARASQTSLVMCLLGLVLFALPHLAAVALGSVVVGMAMGLANPAAAHLLVRYTTPARRNLMFSIKQTGVPLGGVITALTAPVLAVTVGWQWSLAVVAALALPHLAMIRARRAQWDKECHSDARAHREPFGGVPMVWRNAALRWMSVVALLFSAIQRCLLTFTVIYLVAEGRYGLIEAGFMLSVIQIGGAASRICWGWLADRIGSSLAVLMVICAITIAATLLLTALDSGWPRPAVYTLFFVLGATAVGWNGVFHAEAARLSPAGMASVVAGGTSFFVFGGVLMGPAAFTAAYGVLGTYGATFTLLAVAAAAAFVLLLFARSAGR